LGNRFTIKDMEIAPDSKALREIGIPIIFL